MKWIFLIVTISTLASEVCYEVTCTRVTNGVTLYTTACNYCPIGWTQE